MAKFRDADVFFLAAAAAVGLTLATAPRRTGALSVTGNGTATPTEHQLGRDAEGPTQIPRRGWWQVLKRVYAGINDHRVMAEAAGVTYYALLALFPAIASLISLYGLIADPATVSQNLSSLQGILPEGGVQIINEQIVNLSKNHSNALGVGAIVGLLTSLWSANAGIKALFDTLNIVYDEREKRGFFHRTLLSFAFTIGMIVFLILAMIGVVVIPAILNYLGLGSVGEILINLARWPVLLLAVVVLLSLMYRYGPSREKARWQWVSWGGGVAAILWVLVSFAFSFYVSHFGSYNKTYGSLGAAVGFMTWIWISAIVVLVGAELNAELEHQTARDTTTGPPKPMGLRGAEKADTVAA